MEIDKTTLKSEMGDSAYASANNSQESHSSSKSRTSSWSDSSAYDIHGMVINVENEINKWMDKEYVSCGSNINLSEAVNYGETFSDEDKSNPNKCNVEAGRSVIDNTEDEGSFSATVSLHSNIVLHVTGPIFDSLGYAKEMWLGHSLIDFIHPKDRIIFTTHVTMKLLMFDDMSIKHGRHHSFYCRFQMYRNADKDANFGMSNDAKVTYRAFHLSTSLASAADDNCNYVQPKADLQKPGNSLNQQNCNCVVAVMIPLQSAYKVADEALNMCPFVTRHSASCHFSYVDTSAIPYIGYLPQDLLGNSIFDFYHPEDLPQLQKVYEQLVKEEGRLVKSKPYRILIKNGQYILLDTEWTSFVNPWSRKLEFVIGQHVVLKGPTEPNVFADAQNLMTISNEVMNNGKQIQLDIKQTLGKAIKKERKCRRATAAGTSGLKRPEEMVDHRPALEAEDDYACGPDEDKSFSDQGSIVMGQISPHHLQCSDSESSSDNSLPSYHRCNYNDNIQRFFDSNPKTTGSGPDGRPSPLNRGAFETYARVTSGSDCAGRRRDHVVGLIIPGDFTECEGISSYVDLPETAAAIDVSGSSEAIVASSAEPDDRSCVETVQINGDVLHEALTVKTLSRHNEMTEKSFVLKMCDVINHHRLQNSIETAAVRARPDPQITCGTALQSIDDSNRLLLNEVHRPKRRTAAGSHSPDLDRPRKLNKHSPTAAATHMLMPGRTAAVPSFQGCMNRRLDSYDLLREPHFQRNDFDRDQRAFATNIYNERFSTAQLQAAVGENYLKCIENSPLTTDSEGLDDDLTGSSLTSFLKSDCTQSDESAKSSITGEKSDMKWDDDIPANDSPRSSNRPINNNGMDHEQDNKNKPYWMININLSAEKTYQVVHQDLRDVLRSDMQKLQEMPQPRTVNEQLARLYSELDTSKRRATGLHMPLFDEVHFCEEDAIL